MAKKTIAELQVKTTGGQAAAKQLDQVGAATQKVGKNQTRLGQASASAGRSFAAQSQGLGGVVGVYAAAAANVFALTAAFTALNRAAQFETIIRGTEQLANAVGSSATQVIQGLKDITQGQLSIIEAATQANLALSAGFNSKQINELAEVSLKASRALGRNLTDSFQRITRGAIKLEPELLDEIGIFTRIEPAVEAYAASLNKSASQLTNFERRQAFVNQVIKDGQRAFADINDTGETTQEVFEKLVANFSDLAIQAGALVADALVPLAKFLDQSLGNRLVLLGSIAALVFGSLRSALTGFITSGLANLGTKLTGIAEGFRTATKESAAFNSQAKAAAAAFVGGGAFTGAGRGIGASLKKDLAAGNIDLRKSLILQKDIVTLRKNERLEVAALKDNLKRKVISQAEFEKQLRQSVIRQRGLAASAKLTGDIIGNSGKKALFLAAGLNVAAVAASKLAGFMSGLLTTLNVLVAVIAGIQLVGSLFGKDFFGFLTEQIGKIGKTARDTKAGIDELGAAIDRLGNRAEDTNAERFFGLDFAEVIRQGRQAIQDDLLSGDIEVGPGKRAESSLKTLAEQLIDVENQLKRTTDAAERLQLITRREGIKLAIEGQIPLLEKQALAITSLAEESGRAGSIIADNFVRDGILKVDEATNQLVIKTGQARVVVGTFTDGILKLTPAFADAAVAASDAEGKTEELRRKLALGIISPEVASRDIEVIRKLIEESGVLGAVVTAALNVQANAADKVVQKFIQLDQIAKSVRKTFSGELQAADTAIVKGLVSVTGEVAKTEAEINKNRSERLALIAKEFAATRKDPDESIRASAANAFLAAAKASFGFNLKSVVPIAKNRVEEQKRLQALEDQQAVLDKQLTNSQQQLDNQRTLNNRLKEITGLQNTLKIDQAKLALDKAQNAVLQKRLENQKELNALIARESELRLRIAGIRQERANIEASGADADRLAQFQAESARLERETVTVRSDILNREIQLEELKAANRTREIERAEANARFEAAQELTATQNRRNDISAQFSIDQERLRNSLSVIEAERKLAEQQNTIQTKQAESQKLSAENRIKELLSQEELQKLQSKQAQARDIAELKLIEERYKLLNSEIKANNEFLNKQAELINGLIKANAAISGTAFAEADLLSPGTVAGLDLKAINENIQSSITLIETNGEKQRTLIGRNTELAVDGEKLKAENAQSTLSALEEIKTLEGSVFDAKVDAIKEELRGNRTILGQKLTNLDLEDRATFENLQNKLVALGIDKEVAQTALNNAKERLRFELSYQARIIAAGKEITKTIEGGVVDGLLEVNNALIEGTFNLKDFADGLRSFASSLIREIQRIFFTKTIAEPAAEFLAKGFASGFNEIFGTNSTGVDSGPIGFEGTDMSGAVTSAAGGLVHMAAGGMLRDRVPALLEPGEFVVRKAAAKAAGGPALSALNATGQMAGPVSVNIQNEGTPKDAEASAPRFDGEKFVVDIVLRDLSNNGPIRKSLRAGA